MDLTRPGGPTKGLKVSITESEEIYAAGAKERLQSELEAFRLKLSAIDRALSCLEPEERRIVELRYFDDLPWGDVAARGGYSKRSCFKIREKAIKTVAVALFGEKVLRVPLTKQAAPGEGK